MKIQIHPVRPFLFILLANVIVATIFLAPYLYPIVTEYIPPIYVNAIAVIVSMNSAIFLRRKHYGKIVLTGTTTAPVNKDTAIFQPMHLHNTGDYPIGNIHLNFAGEGILVEKLQGRYKPTKKAIEFDTSALSPGSPSTVFYIRVIVRNKALYKKNKIKFYAILKYQNSKSPHKMDTERLALILTI